MGDSKLNERSIQYREQECEECLGGCRVFREVATIGTVSDERLIEIAPSNIVSMAIYTPLVSFPHSCRVGLSWHSRDAHYILSKFEDVDRFSPKRNRLMYRVYVFFYKAHLLILTALTDVSTTSQSCEVCPGIE